MNRYHFPALSRSGNAARCYGSDMRESRIKLLQGLATHVTQRDDCCLPLFRTNSLKVKSRKRLFGQANGLFHQRTCVCDSLLTIFTKKRQVSELVRWHLEPCELEVTQGPFKLLLVRINARVRLKEVMGTAEFCRAVKKLWIDGCLSDIGHHSRLTSAFKSVTQCNPKCDYHCACCADRTDNIPRILLRFKRPRGCDGQSANKSAYNAANKNLGIRQPRFHLTFPFFYGIVS